MFTSSNYGTSSSETQSIEVVIAAILILLRPWYLDDKRSAVKVGLVSLNLALVGMPRTGAPCQFAMDSQYRPRYATKVENCEVHLLSCSFQKRRQLIHCQQHLEHSQTLRMLCEVSRSWQ
ncbi:hypothetical protein AVEN_161461-1 [Araneus ventricosus]|uniref:Uncharacterized protein n=1 Tax=Araneus ventricosus TaxID=182803 RepID=A0A4Y2IGV2_ARAVE|nr:hypothetical protein AVEN_161461-1 [Araneus ventricosus]